MPKRTGFTVAILLVASLCFTSLYLIPRAALFQDRRPIDATPASVGLSYQDVALYSGEDNVRLSAWWIPASPAHVNLLFIHGGGSNRTSEFFRSLDFYREISELGFSVLTLDARNHGTSEGDGKGLRFGAGEYVDVLAGQQWLAEHAPGLLTFAMGKSMGGASLIHAAAHGATFDGLILLDPALDAQSAVVNGIWAATGLPQWMLGPSGYAAVMLNDLPVGETSTMNLGRTLTTPTLLIQDPEDPVTIAPFARALAASNPVITLWEAPSVTPDHPELASKGGWGSHVAAFHLYPQETLAEIQDFVERLAID